MDTKPKVDAAENFVALARDLFTVIWAAILLLGLVALTLVTRRRRQPEPDTEVSKYGLPPRTGESRQPLVSRE